MITAVIPYSEKTVHSSQRIAIATRQLCDTYIVLTSGIPLSRDDRSWAVMEIRYFLHQLCAASCELDGEIAKVYGPPPDADHCVGCHRQSIVDPPLKPSQLPRRKAKRVNGHGNGKPTSLKVIP